MATEIKSVKAAGQSGFHQNWKNFKKTYVITPNPDEGFFNDGRNLPQGANLIPNAAALLFASSIKESGKEVVYSDYFNKQEHLIANIKSGETKEVNLFLGYANYNNGLRLKKMLESKGVKVVLNGIYNFVDGQNFSDCSVLKELGYKSQEPITDMGVKMDYSLCSLDELFLAQEQQGRPRSLVLVSQYEGCPKSKNCLHCSSAKIQMADGSSVKKTKTANETIAEIIELKKKYSIDTAILGDLMVTSARLAKLAEASEGFDLPNLRISTAANHITEESIKHLKQLNCKEVFLGIESYNSELIKTLHKPFTIDDVKRAMKLLFEAGIKANVSLMLGIEGESKTTLENTDKFVEHWREKKIGQESFMKLQTSLVTPIPGSQLYEMFKEKNGAEETLELLKQKDWIGALQRRYAELFLKKDINNDVVTYYSKLRGMSETSYSESRQETEPKINQGITLR